MVDAVARVSRIVWGTRVLDLNCGAGRYARLLAQRTGAEIVGLDRSLADPPPASGRSRARVRWVLGGCEALPFAPGAFAACTMILVVQDLPDLDRVLREVYRVLAPNGGRLTILTMSQGQVARLPVHLFPGAFALDRPRWPALPALKTRVRLAGFQQVRHHLCTVGAEAVPAERFLRWARTRPLPAYRAMDEETFRERMVKFRDRLMARFPDRVVRWRREHAIVTGIKMRGRD